MLKLCKLVMFGAVLIIASEFKAPLMAADKAAARQTSGLTYEGKVIVVDRAAKTVTVEIQKRLYLFKFGSTATVMRKGKKVLIEDVVAGQQVTLRLTETPTGEVVVSWAEIDGAGGRAEAAGTGSGTPSSANVANTTTTPVSGSGSPGRQIVSPYN